MSRRAYPRWWIADLVNRIFYRRQCWADLVSWVMDSSRTREKGLRARLPWRSINKHCLRDAESAGRCYCGKVGSDGTVLRYGQTVCVTRMPGRETDRLCSRPGGHEPPHRCGDVEWVGPAHPFGDVCRHGVQFLSECGDCPNGWQVTPPGDDGRGSASGTTRVGPR